MLPGVLSARGGILTGNGGLIETSGSNFLDVTGIRVDASATNGLGGTWLLDPSDVELDSRQPQSTGGSFSDGNPNIFTPSADSAVVSIDDIKTKLNNGTNVTITTGGTGNKPGNINGPEKGFSIDTMNASPVTLTLQAANDIDLQSFRITSNNGPLSVVLLAGKVGSGSGDVSLSKGSIETAGGAFTAIAGGKVSLESFGISSNTVASATTPITITANNIILTNPNITSNGGRLDVNLFAGKVGSGIGNVSISSSDSNSQTQSGASTAKPAGSSSVENQASGSGDVSITGGLIETNGGAFTAKAAGSFSLNSITIGSNNTSDTAAKPITITADSVSINSGGIESHTMSNGDGGLVTINANSLTLNGGINSNTTGKGNSGGININVDSLSVTNGVIGSDTTGSGNAGHVTVDAKSKVELTEGRLQSKTEGNGNAGAVKVTAKSVSLQNQGGITTTAYGDVTSTGNAGDITVNATDNFQIIKNSGVNSGTLGKGNAGSITINTRLLTIENSGLGSDTGTYNKGNAGNWNITADQVEFNSANISSRTDGSGNGGNFKLVADSLVLRNNSNISTDTQPNSTGNSGLIDIKAKSFLLDNSAINSGTSNSGNGSNIHLQIDEALTMRNSSTISVASKPPDNNSTQLLGNAGDINVQAGSIFLGNKSKIEGDAKFTNGGNIELHPRDLLLLRDGSQITTNAGTGNAGNITIDAPKGFIVALPINGNSDITANAISGSAGSVKITDLRNFFIAPLTRQELKSRLMQIDPTLSIDPANLKTNDITAFSQEKPTLSEQVTINTPNVDPSRGLVKLPISVGDASSKLIDVGCKAFNGNQGSSFFVTGRGGLPPSPDEPLSNDVVWSDTRLPATSEQQHSSKKPTAKSPSKPKAVEIFPAIGWVFNGKGEVTLISSRSNTTMGSTPSCSKR